ncbi:MAG: hypothetical protein ACTHZX_01500, partial [Microbacterium sp.]
MSTAPPTAPAAPAGAPQERDLAGWAAVARHLAGAGLARLRRALRVVRPIGWIVIGIAAGSWIAGLALGWREVTIAALVLTVVIGLCALFL